MLAGIAFEIRPRPGHSNWAERFRTRRWSIFLTDPVVRNSSPLVADPCPLLRLQMVLPTSGARAACVFGHDGAVHLAVPQLAADMPGGAAQMNGGDSDQPMPIFRWESGGFHPAGSLDVPGGEDAEHFQIGPRRFLATASARRGRGPYQPNIPSTIFEWTSAGWTPFQEFEGFFAKQWRYFIFDGRHFMALALGVTVEGAVATNPRESCIYEWDGAAFALLQRLTDAGWGYNWCPFAIGRRQFLAYADHTGRSVIMEWDGARFATFQTLPGKSGRAFQFLAGDIPQLAFASIAEDTYLLDWNGTAFVRGQTLSGPSGREFAFHQTASGRYLVQVNFIQGSPKDPKTDLLSYIHRWQDGHWAKVAEFPTFGATDAAFFKADGKVWLVVTNSLTADVRFGQDMAVYEFLG
jgi:hypothetical protein